MTRLIPLALCCALASTAIAAPKAKHPNSAAPLIPKSVRVYVLTFRQHDPAGWPKPLAARVTFEGTP